MRISREELEKSEDFKGFVGDGKVVLARDIYAKDIFNYSTWLVVVHPAEHNPKPGDRYDLLRFFSINQKIVCSVDKQGVEMVEILEEVMNQLIDGKK